MPSVSVCVCGGGEGRGYLIVLIERSKLLNWFFSRLTITWITLKARVKASSKLRRLVQWNLDLTNLCVTNPRYNEQNFPVPWHSVKLPGSTVSKLHYEALFREEPLLIPRLFSGQEWTREKAAEIAEFLVLESVIRLFSSSLIDRLKSFYPAFSGSLAKAACFRLFNCAIIQGRRAPKNVLDNWLNSSKSVQQWHVMENLAK